MTATNPLCTVRIPHGEFSDKPCGRPLPCRFHPASPAQEATPPRYDDVDPWVCQACGAEYGGPRCPQCGRAWAIRRSDLGAAPTPEASAPEPLDYACAECGKQREEHIANWFCYPDDSTARQAQYRRKHPYDSGTYGELPAGVRSLIVGHEWDNMRRDEQRAWLIATVAALTAERDALQGHKRDRHELDED